MYGADAPEVRNDMRCDKRNRNNLAIGIASITWVYWVLLYVFIFGDLYISWPSAALVMKVLSPVMLIANITGVVFSLLSPINGRFRRLGTIALNAVPPIAAAWFIWWLFFGVRI
jgi:hypothetical protein